jgi:hypothetical protein
VRPGSTPTAEPSNVPTNTAQRDPTQDNDNDNDADLSGYAVDSSHGGRSSSRCSNLYLPDDETATAGDELLNPGRALAMAPHRSPFPSYILQPQVAMNPQVLMEHNTAQRDPTQDYDNDNDADLSGYAVDSCHGGRSLAVDRRKNGYSPCKEINMYWRKQPPFKFLNCNGNRRPAAAAKGERNELAAATVPTVLVFYLDHPAGSRL